MNLQRPDFEDDHSNHQDVDLVTRSKRQRQNGVPLTVGNVTKTLEQVKIRKKNWRERLKWCCSEILMITHAKLDKLTTSCSSNEVECYQAVVSYWLDNYPYASWRELIDRFETKKLHELAEELQGNAEPLTDCSLTPENLSQVLANVKSIELCLKLPPSITKGINQLEVSDEKRMERAISYWLNFSPYANWEELSGRLFNRLETRALDQAKKYIRTIPEPTLTLTNLYKVCIEYVKSWKSHGFVWVVFNIPQPAIDKIKEQYPQDMNQQTRAMCEYFLDYHPAPCWEKVAYVLYIQAFYDNCYEAIEVIQRNYLMGTSETRRRFKQSMVFGHIVSKIVKVLLIGGPGVGKTSTKAVILCEEPPDYYRTTPLAMRAVKVYQIDTSDPAKWVELSRRDRNRVISKAIERCSLGPFSKLPQYCSLVELNKKFDVQRKSSDIENMETDVPTSESVTIMEESTASDNYSTANVTEPMVVSTSTTNELLTFMEDHSSHDPVERICRMQITDSGGQPQFQELLPIFLRGTSLYLFVQKLSEQLSAHTMVEYVNKQGESVCEPYQSSQSNLQIFQHCVRVLASQRIKNEDSIPHLMVIGSFKDKAKDCEETIDDKEKILQELLLPRFEDKVLYSGMYPKRLIFPLNAKNPGVEEAKIAEEIRRIISEKCSISPIEIPLQWHALESLIDELSEKFGRDVLSRQECLSESKKLHFEEDSFNAALLFLESLNVIYYYPQLLPDVVFSNTQVLLDKVTELVELLHRLRSDDKLKVRDHSWQRFHDYALVSVEFLSKYCKRHYVEGLFTASDLVRLFSGLSIFAKFNDNEYFVPALLGMLDLKHVEENRATSSSAIPAMVLTFTNDGPCLGVFCAMIVSLLSQQNPHPCAWELEMESDSITPTCLYRNCVKFVIPKPKLNSTRRTLKYPATVVLIDAFTHFEVHLLLPECASKLATEMCRIIKQAIFEAIHQANLALHYVIPEPAIDALCPCGVGESHAAEVDKDENLMLCSKDTRKCFQLPPNQLIWSEAQDTPPTCGQDSIPDLRQLECIEKNGQTVQLIKRVAPDWESLATALKFEDYEIRTIKMDHRGETVEACRDMLSQWLKYSTHTWHMLIEALDDIELTSIADELKTIV